MVLFAAYLFVDGIMAIFHGFSERRDGQPSGWSFFPGVLAIAFGIAVLVWPDTIGKVIMYIIAIWAILAAIAGIAAGFRMRQTPGSGWGWFLAWGILAGIFGIALIVNPAAGILSILWLVAHLGDHGRHRVHRRPASSSARSATTIVNSPPADQL